MSRFRIPHRTAALKPALLLSAVFCFAVFGSMDSASGQITVQLPTINVFNINTVVSVPDGGTTSLGGVKRHSSGRVSRGVPGLSNIPFAGRPFRNAGIGSETSNSQATVSAKIVSLQEMEDELMSGLSAQSRARQGIPGAKGPAAAKTRKKAAFLSKHMGRAKGR